MSRENWIEVVKKNGELFTKELPQSTEWKEQDPTDFLKNSDGKYIIVPHSSLKIGEVFVDVQHDTVSKCFEISQPLSQHLEKCSLTLGDFVDFWRFHPHLISKCMEFMVCVMFLQFSEEDWLKSNFVLLKHTISRTIEGTSAFICSFTLKTYLENEFVFTVMFQKK